MSLDGWKHDQSQNAITKTFKFKNFSQAWGFMSRIALIAATLLAAPAMAHEFWIEPQAYRVAPGAPLNCKNG